jgi:7-carboxy-7-deazaguanine synthase
VRVIHVLLEKGAVRRVAVDVAFLDVDSLLLQKTSGVAAGRSRGFPEEDRLGHGVILGQPPTKRGSRTIEAVLTVNEIFHSIQGESTHAGRPCVFVRLTACDLRCSWCDTAYAFHEGQRMSIDEIVDRVKAFGCPVVEITGGEPLLQKQVYPLMQRLLDDGLTVLLETGGHRSIEHVPAGVFRVVDVKCPGSGESERNDWTNMDRLTATDEVKFVIRDRVDYEFARDAVARHALLGRVRAVLFSPVHGVLDPKQLAAWVLEDRLEVRVQLQVHKYIWDPMTRGV